MPLNLAIIMDALEDYPILKAKIDPRANRELRYPRYYMGEKRLDSRILHIVRAEQLATDPETEGHASLICLGYPPMAFSSLDCDCLCLEPSSKPEEIF